MYYLTMMFIYRAFVAIGLLVSDHLPKLVLPYTYIRDQDGRNGCVEDATACFAKCQNDLLICQGLRNHSNTYIEVFGSSKFHQSIERLRL